MSKNALTHAPPRGIWRHAPPQKFFYILGPLKLVLVQSESVELRILLGWSDEPSIIIYSSASSSCLSRSTRMA